MDWNEQIREMARESAINKWRYIAVGQASSPLLVLKGSSDLLLLWTVRISKRSRPVCIFE